MNAIQIKALSDELRTQRRLKYNEYHKRYYHKRVKSKPFVSVLDMENPPAKRVYKRENKANDNDDETEDEFDGDTDDNQSIMSDITDCSLINTTYDKSSHLKSLDSQLKETLFNKGFNSQESIANVFSTLRNANPRYGLPVLEQRTERRLSDFYKDTIENLQ